MPKTKLSPDQLKINKTASQKNWREENKERIKSYNAGYYLTHTLKKRLEARKPVKTTMTMLWAHVDFIKHDRNVNRMTLAALAIKYKTNRRAIGRILNPEAK